MEAERRIDADKVVDVLDQIVAGRGRGPEFVRCDNGPEMTSPALRDWCRFSRTGAAFIEPGSPWENPFVESFNSRVRDELLSVEVFSCLTEAKVMIEDFRIDYNRYRPHRAHQMMTPAAFAASLQRPLLRPTATAAGEGIEQRSQLARAPSDPQPVAFRPRQRQNQAEDITPTPAPAHGHGADQRTPTTTQLSQQVDR